MKKIFTIASISAFALMANVSFAQDFCNATHSGEKKTINFNGIAGASNGEIGSYHYEQWSESGTATSEFYTDGSFRCDFENTHDFICREGLFYGSNSGKEPLSIGTLIADFSISDFFTADSVYSAYAGVYGWMENPLIEWYIVDDRGDASYLPYGLDNEQSSIIIDGDEYTIYTATVNRVSINGLESYDQIYSIRKTARKCGSINITAHFKAWKEMGIVLGNSLLEAKVYSEVIDNSRERFASGVIDFNYAKVYVDDGSNKPKSSSSAPQPVSSSEAAPASSSEIAAAIHSVVTFQGKAGTYQVFNMLGKYIGKIELAEGSSMVQALKAKYGMPGIYMLKRAGSVSTIVVK